MHSPLNVKKVKTEINLPFLCEAWISLYWFSQPQKAPINCHGHLYWMLSKSDKNVENMGKTSFMPWSKV